jgi:hypothetical protein
LVSPAGASLRLLFAARVWALRSVREAVVGSARIALSSALVTPGRASLPALLA